MCGASSQLQTSGTQPIRVATDRSLCDREPPRPTTQDETHPDEVVRSIETWET